MKNANLNLDLKSIIPKLKRGEGVALKHAVFIVIIIVLLVYVFVVYKINQFANAEPSDSAQTAALAAAQVPTIKSSAIQQIQSLEQSNTKAQSLFEQARNNPFQE